MMELELGITKEMALVDEWISDSVDCGIETIEDVTKYVIESGGKRIRPTVIILAYKTLNGEDVSKVIPIAATMEIIHTGTIIHDDINDHSLLRRGVPTAYRKFGTTSALLSGDYLFVKAFEAVSEYDKAVRDVIINSCVLLAQGEIVQSQSTGDITLNEEDYMDIITKKTASPISAGAKVGGMLAGGTTEQANALMEYGLNLGIGFQIMDDVLDVTGVETHTGKYAGNDLQEGKTTLLPIHALMNATEDKRTRLVSILSKKNKDAEEIREAIEILESSGSIDYARSLGRDYIEKAKSSISILPDSEWKEKLVKLADFVVERIY